MVEICYPQGGGSLAPLSKDFLEYQKMKKNGTWVNRSQSGYPLGLIPSPNAIRFNPPNKLHKKKTQAFPSSYDLRNVNGNNYVTSVRNQYDVGTCWAFSAVGSIESRWKKLGINADLSEENLATCHGFQLGINDGGLWNMATAYFSRYSGPYFEVQDPYSNDQFAYCPSAVYGSIKAFIPEVRYISKDIDLVKSTIMEFGGLACDLRWEDNAYSISSKTYCYKGSEPTNHAGTCIGWDDSKSTSGGTGAWLIKNTWGTTFGDAGYYWISYQDTRALSWCAYFPSRYDYNSNEKQHLQDGLGVLGYYGFEQSEAYSLVKYTVSGTQLLKRIGTYAAGPGTIIDIEIYDDKSGNNLSNLLASLNSQVCDIAGFYVFDIPTQVNGSFYVKIKYTSPGVEYPIPVEAAVDGFASPYILSGVAWISKKGAIWEEVGNNITTKRFDLCVRAYTVPTSAAPSASFFNNKSDICNGSQVTFTSNSYGTITSYSWNFGEGASPATANTAGPHNITYNGNGYKTVTLTVDGLSGSNTMTKTDLINVQSDIKLVIPTYYADISSGDTVLLGAFGADSYSWSPSLGLSSTSSSLVSAYPTDSTVYTVIGTQGSCSDQAEITVVPHNPPVNDDVCDATLLSMGDNGPFNNYWATKQFNEPLPDTTGANSCTDPLKWCNEGGLQNTVWFKFIGPQDGNLSIDSRGFDQQIAIYDAATCEEVLSDQSNLLAANDDYYPEDKFFASAIKYIQGLTPDKIYWLQLDGSAGGETGEFYLSLSDWVLNANDLEKNNKIIVFPNPSKGSFTIKSSLAFAGDAKLLIYDINGKLHFEQSFSYNELNELKINISDLASGLYTIKFQTNSNVFQQKLIKQ